MGQDLGGLVFFRVMVEYIRHFMNNFLTDTLARMIGFASIIGITLVTLWIIIQGYRIMTGQSRDPLMSFVVQAGKIYFILFLVSSTSIYNEWITDNVTGARDWITYQLTGSNDNVYTQVDRNLAATQIILTAINTINTPNTTKDVTGADGKVTKETERLYYMSAFGSGGPAIIAGMVSLLNEIMLNIAIALGPLFLLGLIFEQTKQMFWSWVKYMFGICASMAVLAVLSSLVLQVTIGYALAMIPALLIKVNMVGADALGSGVNLSQTAMMQGGVGLMMSTLLITIPPAMMSFFGATLGGAVSGYGPFGGGPQPGRGMEGNTKTDQTTGVSPVGNSPSSPSTTDASVTQNQITQLAAGNAFMQRIPEQNNSASTKNQLGYSDGALGNARQGTVSSIYGSPQMTNTQEPDGSSAPLVPRNSFSGLPLSQSNKKQGDA